jgi:hypothetical protein
MTMIDGQENRLLRVSLALFIVLQKADYLNTSSWSRFTHFIYPGIFELLTKLQKFSKQTSEHLSEN